MKCGALGELIIDGRVVGALRCELAAGHDEPKRRRVYPQGRDIERSAYDVVEPATPHEARLHWSDGEVIAEDDSGEPTVDVPSFCNGSREVDRRACILPDMHEGPCDYSRILPRFTSSE